jgi:hypothetical protein
MGVSSKTTKSYAIKIEACEAFFETGTICLPKRTPTEGGAVLDPILPE